jgi:NitT/TauT family transport system ATP-binding protein
MSFVQRPFTLTPSNEIGSSDHRRSPLQLAIRNLSKTYHGQKSKQPIVALQDISLNVVQNEFLCLIGPSGCGKSTLLKIIAGVIPHTSGTIERPGADLGGPNVGMVFQTPVLFPWKDILHNVMLPAILRKVDPARAREEAHNLLAMVGLKGFESRFPYELSGGMQQRASICRALMCDAPLLLMDEPFGALDALTRDELAVELKTICGKQTKTVVFVTHSIPEAVFLGDRIAVMSARPGRIERIFEIGIDRKNDLSIMATGNFQALVTEIRKLIEDSRARAKEGDSTA